MLVEGFGGCLPAEGLAGSAVERGGDGFELVAVPAGEVGALREVLAQQAVGVLVGAALPGAVRVGEVDGDAGLDLELGVLRTSSLPRSQVNDRRSCSGSVVIVAASASFIVIGAVAGERRAVLRRGARRRSRPRVAGAPAS